MPVIQLPKDTRWGDLGAGLGTAITAITEGLAEKNTSEGVAQIMRDPMIAEADKQYEAYKKYGTRGGDLYKQLLTTQVLSATVEEKRAEAAKNRAAVGQQTATDDLIRMLNAPRTAAPTTGVLPQVPVPGGTPVAPTDATAAPASTATSVIPDVLGANAQTPATPAAAPTPAPASAAPAAPTAAALAASGAIVGALSGTPAPAPTALEDMIDERARIGGVTFTPTERQNLALVTTGHLRQRTGLAEAMAPVDAAIKLKREGMQFPSQLDKSRSEAETAAAGAATARAKGAADLAAEQARLDEIKANTQVSQQSAAATKPVNVDLRTFPTFTPEQSQAVYAAGQSGGLRAASAEISKVVAENAKGAGLSTDSIKFARDAASYGAITERFANEMMADPAKLGALNLSGIKARLEERGVPIGDPALVNLLSSQKLAAATAARENGNWGVSGTNLTLSKQTSANIDKTVLSNVMMFAGTAAQKLAEAEVEKAAYAGNPRAQAAIDQAIQPWRNIQKMTDTLNSTTVPVDPSKPKGAERDVMYFMGNQVNPNTMVPIVRQDNTMYAVKPREGDKTSSYTGADIFAMARAAGIDPALMLQKLGGKP